MVLNKTRFVDQKTLLHNRMMSDVGLENLADGFSVLRRRSRYDRNLSSGEANQVVRLAHLSFRIGAEIGGALYPLW